jgi:anti-sigma-K factor RskA
MVCDEDEGNAAYDEAMNQLSEAGFAWARSDGVGPEAAAELAGAAQDDLLGTLKTEPSTDEDCAARFTLYERHAETVASMRNSLLKFWEDAKVEMTEAAPRAAIDEQIRQIDNHRNLELFELSHYWFVYSMAVAVSKNEKKIQEVLRAIRSKITLLAEDGQNCSICLEPMLGSSQGATANSVVALGCAHKLHADCWRHWSAHCVTSRKEPFCPTCRNNDFLDEIL